jgi:hypothetical protein
MKPDRPNPLAQIILIVAVIWLGFILFNAIGDAFDPQCKGGQYVYWGGGAANGFVEYQCQ